VDDCTEGSVIGTLSLSGYQRPLIRERRFHQKVIRSGSLILQQFQTGGFLDLMKQSALAAISSHNAITLISANRLLWPRHLGVDDALCRRLELLELIPYIASRRRLTNCYSERCGHPICCAKNAPEQHYYFLNWFVWPCALLKK
jgi:hypothetical protein